MTNAQMLAITALDKQNFEMLDDSGDAVICSMHRLPSFA